MNSSRRSAGRVAGRDGLAAVPAARPTRGPRREGIALAAALSCLAATPARADDKRAYSLVDPTPDRLLRDMATDRPDITETPFTVDAGRVQVESTMLGFARSRPDTDRAVTQGYEFVSTNLRIGLTHDTEATLVLQPYARQRASGPLGTTHASGPGALLLRAKFNLWGNDAFSDPGSTAFALLPSVSLPTDRRNGISPDGVDGGLSALFAVRLDGGFSLGINAGVQTIGNASADGRHLEYSGSASLGYEWSERLTTYVELATRVGTRDPLGDILLIGGGLSFRITRDLQLDGGLNLGLTRASARFGPFVGVSARF